MKRICTIFLALGAVASAQFSAVTKNAAGVVNGNLTVATGASLTISGNQTINPGGSLLLNGNQTVNAGSTITLYGNHTISGNGTLQIAGIPYPIIGGVKSQLGGVSALIEANTWNSGKHGLMGRTFTGDGISVVGWSSSGASAGKFIQDTDFSSPAITVWRDTSYDPALTDSPAVLLAAGAMNTDAIFPGVAFEIGAQALAIEGGQNIGVSYPDRRFRVWWDGSVSIQGASPIRIHHIGSSAVSTWEQFAMATVRDGDLALVLESRSNPASTVLVVRMGGVWRKIPTTTFTQTP